jgi:hypothetical protein
LVKSVLAGLDPAIHVFQLKLKGVDHRVKPGDDEVKPLDR